MNLSRVDRERLLEGNWKVRPSAGSYFPRHKVSVLAEVPTDVKRWVRKWDLAATTPSESNPSPDATCGVLMGLRDNGRLVIANVINVREDAHEVRRLIKNTAEMDTALYGRGARSHVTIVIPIDPGSAGKDVATSYASMLLGYSIRTIRETGSKIVRCEPFSSQWCAGNVDIVSSSWNSDYLRELEHFPEGMHDDAVDASSGAFIQLTEKVADNRRWRALAS
jgi:predicted phage terminase large subunit-like protein